jgi:tRNA threonylcarbamoyl adenosine modification protein (Sua5/YciO/YrdC/YwlC family)
MLLRLHPDNPQPRNTKMIIECLLDGGVIIYPTDTIYGLGCDIFQHKAVDRICRIKQVDPAKAQLSFICYDLSDLSAYTKSISTPLYRLLKTYLPGPYTFILPASKQVPKILKGKKDTIGLRIPDNIIARSLIRELGHPILSSSLPGHGRPPGDDGNGSRSPVATQVSWDLPVEEYTDPEMMYEKFGTVVDIVVDGGIGGMVPSTVVDCTGDEPVVIRQGLGHWDGQL